MRVSVITVCYNSEKFIARSIESVLAQFHKDLELIIIDGGSTDKTLEVVKSYKDARIKFLSEVDFGIYDAMNKGLKIASGDIICFLNSDDYYADENVLTQVVMNFAENGYDILLGDIQFFNARRAQQLVRIYPARRFKANRLKFGWMPPHPGFFARRTVYENYGFFDVSYKVAGDFDFIARVFVDSKVEFSYLNRVVVKMAVGGVSTSGLVSKIRLNCEVMRACRQNGIRTNWLFLMMKYPLKIFDMVFKKT
jgi:glycosyltransferase involved in cell wall biosynthesis